MRAFLLGLGVFISGWARPHFGSRSSDGLPGTYVTFDSLRDCPQVTAREARPSIAADVRPDDISVVMALGDSITAGFLAQSTDFLHPRPDSNGKIIEQDVSQRPIFSIPIAREYRGLSYPIGGDSGAITLPNILSHWSSDLKGMSRGHHPLLACIAGKCLWRHEDGLNAAISGSRSADLVLQVKDYILPRMKEMDLEEERWSFVNIGIGANDLCAFCLSPNSTLPFVGTPQEFAKGIQDAVELLREQVPHLIVNIMGLFKVSAIYTLTLKDPYCRGPFLPPLPHLPLECSCAMLPGPAGDYTRSKMDQLSEEYDEAVKAIIREWTNENDPSFGVTWQPGSMVDLENWPIESLSPTDCFHPSKKAHQRVAAGLWNRLTLSQEDKAKPIIWKDEVSVRCLQDDDRIRLGA